MTTSPPDAPPSPESEAGLPARKAVLRALMRVEQDAAWIGRLDPDSGRTLDARQRRQATDALAGVTRHRRWLDFLIDHYYHRGLADLQPEVRQTLRLGLYELLVAATPSHAAVSQAVELVRAAGQPRAAGLVNAILRRAGRERRSLPEPDSGDPAEDLAIRHSHPTWMVRRWLDRWGREETLALLDWNNRRPRHCLRINRLLADRDMLTAELDRLGIEWAAGTYLPDEILRLPKLQSALAAGLIRRGWCMVQDEAAALVVHLLDPRPGERVLDACAAPGGKALFIAERMGDRGRILASDRHAGRLARLAELAEARELGSLETRAADLRSLSSDLAAKGERFDRLLLDAPCSGTGVLAKRADLRWRRELQSLAGLADLQDALLDAAAPLVAPGGLLVYSTCSIEPEENGARVEAFLARQTDFRLEPAGDLLSSELIDESGCYASFPQRHGMDGAFGARLRRRDEDSP